MPEVYFVGCGPGDPDLITVKARKIIRRAGTVVYSGSLVPAPIMRLCKNAQVHDASKLVREEIFELLKKGAKKGEVTVRLHDGDPTIYGAIREQMDALHKEGIRCIVIPGVTAFLAAAAALGAQLTLPGVTQTIIVTRAGSRTKVPERERIRELAKHGATMVFYLSAHLLRDIVKEVRDGGCKSTTPAAVIYRAGWKDEKIVTGTLDDIVKNTAEAGITRTAVIIIGDIVRPESYEYSRLYDRTFSHGYRKAKSD